MTVIQHIDEYASIMLIMVTGRLRTLMGLELTFILLDCMFCCSQMTNLSREAANSSVALHPDGQILGTGTGDSVVHVWETRSQNVSHGLADWHKVILFAVVMKQSNAQQECAHIPNASKRVQWSTCENLSFKTRVTVQLTGMTSLWLLACGVVTC